MLLSLVFAKNIYIYVIYINIYKYINAYIDLLTCNHSHVN